MYKQITFKLDTFESLYFIKIKLSNRFLSLFTDMFRIVIVKNTCYIRYERKELNVPAGTRKFNLFLNEGRES